ncbi:hypothetical protein COCVIDRAFT_108341 [Bipolaris victoriae FI3]|uniref:Uncharacterized protein n=1 Tax=Bipolaris victoriae (strain FI3) TaxID=930091 RepID=W7ECG7_BIPV3|nr:hypothetical protein COCVIDRAFT_108341 [Bipolaris victoriae FI3]
MTRNRRHYETILHSRFFIKSEKRTKDSFITKASIHSRRVTGRISTRNTRTQSEKLVARIRCCIEDD